MVTETRVHDGCCAVVHADTLLPGWEFFPGWADGVCSICHARFAPGMQYLARYRVRRRTVFDHRITFELAHGDCMHNAYGV